MLILALGASQVHAQSFCASDGQAQPARLMERFISADCADCWTDAATPRAPARTVALDWVLPSAQGDGAPLSAVATLDAQRRADALSLKPAPQAGTTARVDRLQGARLRVAHGLPFNGYVGASIELKPVPRALGQQTWTAWLALVETLPAGTEGSPVERNLVRNLLQLDWDGRTVRSAQDRRRLFEARSMSLPEGTQPDRVRVIGWVQNAQGRVMAAAQSSCGAVR